MTKTPKTPAQIDAPVIDAPVDAPAQDMTPAQDAPADNAPAQDVDLAPLQALQFGVLFDRADGHVVGRICKATRTVAHWAHRNGWTVDQFIKAGVANGCNAGNLRIEHDYAIKGKKVNGVLTVRPINDAALAMADDLISKAMADQTAQPAD